MKKIKLPSSKFIGNDQTPFIIAEIGNNHNGNLELAHDSSSVLEQGDFLIIIWLRIFCLERLYVNYIQNLKYGFVYDRW